MGLTTDLLSCVFMCLCASKDRICTFCPVQKNTLDRILFFFIEWYRFGQEKNMKQSVTEAVNRGGADVSSLLRRM